MAQDQAGGGILGSNRNRNRDEDLDNLNENIGLALSTDEASAQSEPSPSRTNHNLLVNNHGIKNNFEERSSSTALKVVSEMSFSESSQTGDLLLNLNHHHHLPRNEQINKSSSGDHVSRSAPLTNTASRMTTPLKNEEAEVTENSSITVSHSRGDKFDSTDVSTPHFIEDSSSLPEPAPPQDEGDSNEATSSYQRALEDRVQDLETKLATLSLILQQQHHQEQPRRLVSRFASPNHMTPSTSDDEDDQLRNTPLLDSPAPPTPGRKRANQRRNLSFRVLYQEGEATPPLMDRESGEQTDETRHRRHHTDDSSDPSVIFLSNNLPDVIDENLSPSISESEGDDHEGEGLLQASSPPSESEQHSIQDLETPRASGSTDQEIHQKQQSSKKGQILTSSSKCSSSLSEKSKSEKHRVSQSQKQDATPKVPEGKDESGKTKWLDFLNSFQDSSYDADKQMEEFVKVPSAVESLLSFGFWICVDSFLYVLTILPIRFTWSCLILVRSAFYRTMLRTTVPEGPFRFHRR